MCLNLWTFFILHLAFVSAESYNKTTIITVNETLHLPSDKSLSLMKTCPFPMPKTIQPCACKVDEEFRIFLICNIHQDMTDMLLQRLTYSFGYKKDVYLMDVNLNGHSWKASFNQHMLGQFRISHFHLSNLYSFDADIRDGAFHGSSLSLKTFNIETSVKSLSKRVRTGAFSNLQGLHTINLGNSFGEIARKGFYDLPSLQLLTMDKDTLLEIESEAFGLLPKLNTLDLSNQLVSSLYGRTFCNLPNLTKLDLSSNRIKRIHNNAVEKVENLLDLDLSRNSDLCNIGNILELLPNPDLAVNLAETNVDVLLQDSFKTFVERVSKNKGKGFLVMSSVPLQCSCDVKWLLTSNMDWTSVFQNSSCQDGINLGEVDTELLEDMCPPENYPRYDAGYGQMYEMGVLSSPGFPHENYTSNLWKNYKIVTSKVPIYISFTHFSTEARRDFVWIEDGDGTRLLRKTSGNSIPEDIMSWENTVYVKFNTDGRKEYSGWQLEWQVGESKIYQVCECCLD